MSWITENPIPLFILGLMVQIVLGIALWQTGRGWLLSVMAALGITSIGLLVLERWIVSPTEQIANTLDEIAAALEANDVDRVLTYCAPEETILTNDVRQQLRRVEITEAVVTGDLRVTFDPPAADGKQKATASFMARFKGRLTGDATSHEQAIMRLRVHFREDDDGKWLVTGYELNRR